MTAATSRSSPPIFRPSLWVEPPRHNTTVPVDSPTVSNVQHIDAIIRAFIRTRQRTAVDLCTTQPRLAPRPAWQAAQIGKTRSQRVLRRAREHEERVERAFH
jgi:hypothetical protein